jgi:hypothetical protein
MEDIDPKILKTIELAKNYTLENPRPKKHTSLIVRKGKVVSVGTNENRTHPLAKKYGYRYDEVHSELDALLRYRGPKNNLILVNYRMNRFGDMRMSKPCCKCMAWCAAIFDRIYYTTSNGLVLLND